MTSVLRFTEDSGFHSCLKTSGEFGVSKELVDRFFQPYVYLNRETIAKRDLDFAKVSRRVAEELSKFPGVAFAVSSHDLRAGAVARTPVTDAVLANFHEDRSGDIYIVQEPYWFLFDKGPIKVMHGSPWRYDTHVPVILAVPGIAPRTVHRRIQTIDVLDAPPALTLGSD